MLLVIKLFKKNRRKSWGARARQSILDTKSMIHKIDKINIIKI